MFLPPGFVCQDPLLKQMRSDKAGFDPAVKNLKTQVGVEISKLANKKKTTTLRHAFS